MTELIIRPADFSDAAALASLLAQLGYESSSDQVQARLARVQSQPAAQTLVAEQAGRVVGLVSAHIEQVLETDAALGRLTLLVVDDSCRGQGIGARLVEAIEGWMRAQGAGASTLTSRTWRVDAHRFYATHGYEETGLRLVKNLKDE